MKYCSMLKATFRDLFWIDLMNMFPYESTDSCPHSLTREEYLQTHQFRKPGIRQHLSTQPVIVDTVQHGSLDGSQQVLPVLRVVDLATEEGDARFANVRIRLLNDLNNALAAAAMQTNLEQGGNLHSPPICGSGQGLP